MESTYFAGRSIKSELSPEYDTIDTCRLCMAHNTAMKQLFRTGTDNIVEMIRFCTGVEFKKEEDLPTQICKSCSEDLTIAHAFKTLCLSADDTFRKYLVSNRTEFHNSYSCEKLTQGPPAPSEDENGNNVDSDNDNKDVLQHSDGDDEMVIGVVMVKDGLLEDQKPDVGLKKEIGRFNCHICCSSFPLRESWKDHLLQRHALATPVPERGAENEKQVVVDERIANFINVSNKEGKFFECNICRSCFRYHDCWKHHLLEQHEAEVAVQVEDPCGRMVPGELCAKNMNVSDSVQGLDEDKDRNSNLSDDDDNGVRKQSDGDEVSHAMVMKDEIVGERKANSGIGEWTTKNGNRFICPICGTICPTRKSWRQHQVRSHGVTAPRLRPGRKKKKVVEDPSSIKMNDSESVQELPLPSTVENGISNETVNHEIVGTCEIVDEPKYISEMCILETEDGIRFYCPICHSSCLTRKAWRQHQLRQHGATRRRPGRTKKQAAGVPRSKIKTNSTQRKVVLEKNEEDYICEVCGKVSKQMGAHFGHLTSHLPARFFCDHCEYKTSQKADLLKHIRIHSGIKMYRCEHCPFSSYNSSNLFRHIRCVHERVKPHTCHICGHKCTDKRTLRIHIESHDGIQRFQCDICHSGFRSRYSWKKHLLRQHGVAVPVQKAGRRKELQIVGELSANNIDVMCRKRTTRYAGKVFEGENRSFS